MRSDGWQSALGAERSFLACDSKLFNALPLLYHHLLILAVQLVRKVVTVRRLSVKLTEPSSFYRMRPLVWRWQPGIVHVGHTIWGYWSKLYLVVANLMVSFWAMMSRLRRSAILVQSTNQLTSLWIGKVVCVAWVEVARRVISNFEVFSQFTSVVRSLSWWTFVSFSIFVYVKSVGRFDLLRVLVL